MTEERISITSKEALLHLIEEAVASEKYCLTDLDLSLCDLRNICFKNFTLENIIFSRHSPFDEFHKTVFNVSFENASLKNVSFAHASLKQCNFDKSISHNSDFFYSKLDVCRFRSAQVTQADFRYSQINNCSLSGCLFQDSDFYMCGFKGVTTFHDTTLIRCSITDTIFENNIIRIDNVKSLLQEDYENYIRILQNTSNRIHNPLNPEAHKVHNHDLKPENRKLKESKIAAETADAYLTLSGIYQGKGYTRDSNIAYSRANNWRLIHHLLEIRNNPLSIKAMGNALHVLKYSSIAIMGYGYQWWKVCLIFLLVAIIGGCYMHYSVPDMDVMEAYARGLNNTLSPQESFAERVGNFLYSSTHSAFGLLIIGFLGFILANKVRNNS